MLGRGAIVSARPQPRADDAVSGWRRLGLCSAPAGLPLRANSARLNLIALRLSRVSDQ
jgi:hypothetical protein